MINTKYLANYFTNLLNEYGYNYGKYFKIFADEGELKKATKDYGKAPIDYTSGIVEVLSSQLTPIRDIRLYTYSVQITLFVDLALSGFNEDKESYNFIDIRDILTNIISDKNGETTFPEIGGKNFNQTLGFNYPTNGTKSDVGFISDCMPIYWSCNIALFEDGVNANECKIFVNGEELSFTRVVFTRQRTADSQTFNGDISQKTTMQSQGLSVDLVVPALKLKKDKDGNVIGNEVSQLIMQDVLNGGNYALHCKIETPSVNKTFIGTFGNTQASLDIATNIGHNISIVEAKENLLDYVYTNKWQVYKGQESITIDLNKKSTIYWGDGVVEELDIGEHTHNYNDKKMHTIYIFGG